jgi:hypothetical protein
MWVVWFRDHIHTDAHGQLACFATKRQATAWIKKHDIIGACTVVSMTADYR